MKTLFPAQAESCDSLVRSIKSYNAALDASVTGTGKTLKAIEIARKLGLRAFVVCPKPVIPAWRREFEDQGVEYIDVLNYEKLRTGNTDYLIRSGKNFKWTLPQDALIIFDEVQNCKGLYTLNAKMLIAARSSGRSLLLLSATAAKSPAEMRSIGYALGLHNLRNFYSWGKKYGCDFNRFKQFVFQKDFDFMLEDLNKIIYPARGHKLTRDDLGDGFKRTRILTNPIDFGDGGAIAQLYSDMEKEIAALKERKKQDVLNAGENEVMEVTRLLRLRQEVELLKVPVVVDMIKGYRDEGKAVVFFANFNATLDAVAEKLTEPKGFIRGGQKAQERQEYIDRFQHGDLNIMLANIQAGGVGVNLHDEHGIAERVTLINPTYNEMDLVQALGRVDRMGSHTDSVQHVLVTSGTIEEKVAESAAQKISNLDLLHAKQGCNNKDIMTKPPASGEGSVHAEFGPSQLKYFRKCPGYQGRSGESNPAAEMGTRIHLALETGDFSGLSDWENMLAESCDQSVWGILAHHKFEYDEDIKEIRVNIYLGDDEETFGTCDRLFLNKKKKWGVAMDYKTGKGSIDDAEENDQALAYALGIFQLYPWLETLEFWFIIPQLDELSHATFHRKDIPELQRKARETIQKARAAKKMFEEGSVEELLEVLQPHENVCDFCARAWDGSCPKVTQKVVEIADKYGPVDDFPLPEILHGQDLNDPKVVSMLYKLVPIVEAWASGIKYRARQMAFDEGIDLDGFERGERKGRRKITSVKAAHASLQDLDINLEDFLEVVGDVKITQFEQLIKDNAPRGKKAEKVKEILASLFEADALTLGEPTHFLRRVR